MSAGLGLPRLKSPGVACRSSCARLHHCARARALSKVTEGGASSSARKEPGSDNTQCFDASETEEEEEDAGEDPKARARREARELFELRVLMAPPPNPTSAQAPRYPVELDKEEELISNLGPKKRSGGLFE